MALVITSPQVQLDPVAGHLVFFNFDEKAVTSVVDSTGVPYKLHHHAASSVVMRFDDEKDLNTAVLALKLHYSPLNDR